MTRKQRRQLRRRLVGACCTDVHGFGRNGFGQQDLRAHLERVARVVENAKERNGQ